MTLPLRHEEAISKAHDSTSFDCGDNDLNIFCSALRGRAMS